MPQDEDDAPPAIPEWDASGLARQIAAGHGDTEHFEQMPARELAAMIQHVMDEGRRKHYRRRSLYWDAELAIAVLVNPRDEDGGSVFHSSEAYFAEWGYPEEG
ncbi:MAG: hypothetical protein M3P30_14680 [Chloroflexota bacterium]|nr:hypothetical protein [Chloroflexota bacterium]